VQSVAVVIVSDGRDKANEGTLKYMENELGLFDEKLMTLEEVR
jgi:hypothetical protein